MKKSWLADWIENALNKTMVFEVLKIETIPIGQCRLYQQHSFALN